MFDDFISDFRGFVEQAATQLNITDPKDRAKLEWLLASALEIGAEKCAGLPPKDQKSFVNVDHRYCLRAQRKVL